MDTQRQILLLEDDPDSIRLVKQKLKSSGAAFAVTSIGSGESFAKALAGSSYDCVGVDYTLPDNG